MDAAARTIATAMVMHRASWLHSAALLRQLRATIEDLPFDKVNLFTEKTDEVMHMRKDLQTTALYPQHIHT